MVKDLSDRTFDLATAEGISVVDFWADWCQPCRMMSPIYESAAEEMPDVKFFKLNLDEYEQVGLDKGVSSIPTIMIFRDGEKVGTLVGAMPKQKLLTEIKRFTETSI